jgi:transposase
MKITTKEVREVNKVIDEIIKEYKEEHPKKKRDWRTYEQQFYERLKVAFNELKPLVLEAVKSVIILKNEAKGAKPKLSIEQKVLILLLQRLFQKSNRNMSGMMIIFSWLTDVSVSYKTIERIYSEEPVIMALHNLHQLILKKKGVNEAHTGGDGTGYSLTVKKHYASSAQKLKNKLKDCKGKENKKSKKRVYIYSFALMDLKTRMHIGFGISFTSEKKAFNEAMKIAKETNVSIKSFRFDKYFSAQKYAKFFGKNYKGAKLYLIPKKNATIKGPWNWKHMLKRFIDNTKQYLEEYYKRNQTESGFSEDKKRTGWKLGQKRTDRINTANICISLWHNLYWLAD